MTPNKRAGQAPDLAEGETADGALTINLEMEVLAWIDRRVRELGMTVCEPTRAGVAQSLIRSAIVQRLSESVDA